MGELVSVVICAYNHEKFVAEAIESVFRQDYRPLQLIVSDDGSRDGTRAAIEAKLVEAPEDIMVARCHVQQNTGLAQALNRAGALIAGRIAVMLAGDDIAETNRVRRTMEAFVEHPGATMIWSAHSSIDESGRPLPIDEPLGDEEVYALEDYYRGARPGILGATCAYVREAFSEFGPMDPKVRQEDLVLPCRCLGLGIGVRLPDRLVRYRVHGGNVHFGGYDQSSLEVAARIVGLFENRLAVARQKTADLSRLSLLGRPVPEAVADAVAKELSAAKCEGWVRATGSRWIRAWRLLDARIKGRVSTKDAVRLFLLYVAPFAYLTVLRMRQRFAR